MTERTKVLEMVERYVSSVESREDLDDKNRQMTLVSYGTLKALIDTIKSIEEDLTIVCRIPNPCLVCGHYRPERVDYEKCELKEWTCEWVWRGRK